MALIVILALAAASCSAASDVDSSAGNDAELAAAPVTAVDATTPVGEVVLGPAVSGNVNDGINLPTTSVPQTPSLPTLPPPPDPVTVIAAGNLGGCTAHSAEVIEAIAADEGTILAAGDLSADGTAASLDECFSASLGADLDRLLAVPGDRDLAADGRAAFYDVVAQSATETQFGEGWFVATLGAWQVIGLNSECDLVGGCGVGSTQYQWLDATLREQPADCRLAVFHDVRFTSELGHEDADELGAIVGRLDGAGTDVIVTGSSTGYERLGPVRPSGQPADAEQTGIMHFNIGGGSNAHIDPEPQPGSAVIESDTNGYVRFVLGPEGYTWEFVAVSADGADAVDSGSATC